MFICDTLLAASFEGQQVLQDNIKKAGVISDTVLEAVFEGLNVVLQNNIKKTSKGYK